MKITLTNGIEIEVSAPPTWRAYELAEKMHPAIEVPVVTSTTVTGAEVSMSIDDDPEYLRKVAERDDKVAETASDLYLLFALKSVVVPDDFDVTDYAEICLWADPDWEPRKGAAGRKLDYIHYDLLAGAQDFALIQQIINDMSVIDQEAVAAITASFQR